MRISYIIQAGKHGINNDIAKRMIQPTKIKKTGEKELTIVWSDGEECVYSTVILRRKCPCATCRTEQEEKGIGYIPLFSGVSLRLDEIRPLGRYALLFVWGDGHDTGIYDYQYLRELCREKD